MQHATDPSIPDAAALRRRDLGERITELRELHGIDRAELALMIDREEPLVGDWENGLVHLTLEEALDIDEAMGVPRGTLAAAGRYVAEDVTPASAEEVISVTEYDHPKHLWRAMKAALELGLGVRVRNQLRVVENDETWRLTEMEWLLTVTGGAFDPEEPLD